MRKGQIIILDPTQKPIPDECYNTLTYENSTIRNFRKMWISLDALVRAPIARSYLLLHFVSSIANIVTDYL